MYTPYAATLAGDPPFNNKGLACITCVIHPMFFCITHVIHSMFLYNECYTKRITNNLSYCYHIDLLLYTQFLSADALRLSPPYTKQIFYLPCVRGYLEKMVGSAWKLVVAGVLEKSLQISSKLSQTFIWFKVWFGQGWIWKGASEGVERA